MPEQVQPVRNAQCARLACKRRGGDPGAGDRQGVGVRQGRQDFGQRADALFRGQAARVDDQLAGRARRAVQDRVGGGPREGGLDAEP